MSISTPDSLIVVVCLFVFLFFLFCFFFFYVFFYFILVVNLWSLLYGDVSMMKIIIIILPRRLNKSENCLSPINDLYFFKKYQCHFIVYNDDTKEDRLLNN